MPPHLPILSGGLYNLKKKGSGPIRSPSLPEGGKQVGSAALWLFIFISGVLCLSWPVMEIFHANIVTYVFVFWFLFILVIAFTCIKVEKKEEADKNA